MYYALQISGRPLIMQISLQYFCEIWQGAWDQARRKRPGGKRPRKRVLKPWVVDLKKMELCKGETAQWIKVDEWDVPFIASRAGAVFKNIRF